LKHGRKPLSNYHALCYINNGNDIIKAGDKMQRSYQMSENIDAPLYAKIALDVASRIYRGEFKEGDKISGRSTLASEYNVSPETIRRSMSMLEDLDVVSVGHGKGVKVVSRKNASIFIERFKNKENIGQLRKELVSMIEHKQEIDAKILKVVDKLIDYSDRLRSSHKFNPIEVVITANSKLIGKSINDTSFWQNTGATIIGIRRDSNIILSPGPYASFMENDVLVVIGEMEVLERIDQLQLHGAIQKE
jgi:K+/H+ antiporter YhaU regulatory subunit KhtT